MNTTQLGPREEAFQQRQPIDCVAGDDDNPLEALAEIGQLGDCCSDSSTVLQRNLKYREATSSQCFQQQSVHPADACQGAEVADHHDAGLL